MTVIDSITYLDRRMLIWVSNTRYFPLLTAFFRAVSKTGDGYAQVILPLSLWLVSGGAYRELVGDTRQYNRGIVISIR